MRAWALARLGLSVAATAALTGCSDGDAPMFTDVLSTEGGPSEPEGATTPGRQQLGTASSMPAALRIAAITAAQENASAHYDFERGPAETADRLIGHNHAQRLGIDVDDQGAHVTDMGAGNEGARWRLGLRLGQVCRASSCTRMVAENAALDGSRNRAIIRHVGGVDEWYVNGPLGLEQGFTIAHRPTMAGEADGAPLVLEVDLSGDLSAMTQPDGGWVSLVDESGRAVARYSDLYARDAGGRLLDASMVASDERISLVVSDEGASYPIEVDPLVWVELRPVVPDDPEDGAAFGWSVAIDGDIAVVGADLGDCSAQDCGVAYVFERDYPSTGDWGQRKKLIATDAAANDVFAYSLAVSESTIVVGAYGEDTAATTAGAAYVFERDQPTPDNWGQSRKLVANDAAASAEFGRSVGISGDLIVVGARGASSGGSSRGAAYVFERDYPTVGAWGQRSKLVASDAQDWDELGRCVSISGATAIVGAYLEDGAGGSGSSWGAAYVFEQDYPSANAWGQRKKLVASDAQNSAFFGMAVSLDGDFAAVGATGEEAGAVLNAGAAYVFERNYPTANNWGQRVKLWASTPATGADFGQALALSADTLIVGAPDAAGGGAIYVYKRNYPTADDWGERTTLTASDGGGDFGNGVSVSSDMAVVGAPLNDGGGSDRGHAYLLGLRLTNGETCTDALECVSGLCVDGVCCESECAGGPGDCQACSVTAGAATDGTCGPRSDGAECDDGAYCNGLETCTSGVCGDSAGDPCAANVGDVDADCSESCDEAAQSCVTEDPDGSACDDGTYCNGDDTCQAGVCSSAGTDPCTGPDDDEDCQESCDEAADSCTASDPDGSSCADGSSSCHVGQCLGAQGSECTDGAECATSYCTDGVCCTESDCAPYRCGPAGDCGSTCTMSAECATGFHCDGTGRCVADAAPGSSTEDEGGCSCRLGSERRERDGLVSLLGIATALGLRRRRRA